MSSTQTEEHLSSHLAKSAAEAEGADASHTGALFSGASVDDGKTLKQSWVYVPQKGEFVPKFAKLTAAAIIFYNDDSCAVEFGAIKMAKIASISEAVLDGADDRDTFEGRCILALWKKDKSVYYFLSSIECDAREWKQCVRLVVAELHGPKKDTSGEAAAGECAVAAKKRAKVAFPLPGVVMQAFSSSFFRECVRYLYVERQRAEAKYQLVEHKYSNFLLSPVGTYGLLALLWAGAKEDSATHMQLKQLLIKMPDYNGTGMGFWKCDRQVRTKQLLLYLRRLTGEFTDSYKAETERMDDVKTVDSSEDDCDFKEELDITSLFISNVLFVDSVFELTTAFKKKFRKYVRHAAFYDETRHREVRRGIDEWVAAHSCGKLVTGVGQSLRLTEASAIGVSTLYFHGHFRYQWDVVSQPMAFFQDAHRKCTLKHVSFMRSDARRVLYYRSEDRKLTVVAMDYQLTAKNAVDRLSLVLVKRNYTSAREHVARKPTNITELYRMLAKAKKRRVTICMPRLNLECVSDLSGILESTSLDVAFDSSKADFKRMCAASRELGLYLSQFVHCVHAVVDESGKEPMPAPSGRSSSTGLLQETFDYPFDMFVLNPDSDLVFLSGRVADPNPNVKFDSAVLSSEEGTGKQVRDAAADESQSKGKGFCSIL